MQATLPSAPQTKPLADLLPPWLEGTTQRIYLMRHGETDYNAQNIVQGGGIDSVLNSVGHHQSGLFYEAYKKTSFSAVYSSPLQRARQTLQPFVNVGYALNIHPGLTEMGWGVMEGLRHNHEIEKHFRATLDEWAHGNLDHSVEGGESPNEVRDRVCTALTDILTRHSEGNLLICTHGRTLRIFLCFLLGYDLRHMQMFRHQNTAVNILVRAGRAFYIQKMNDTSHLHPALS